MADLLKVEDLEKAKKHDTFHSEVITGKGGGLSGGADIDYATNAVTGQVQKTLPAIIDSLDWTPIGTFASGVTFTKPTDFAIDGDGAQWIYTGPSPFPVIVAPGTVPSSPDYKIIYSSDYGELPDGRVIQHRRGSSAEIASYVLADGEIIKNDDDGSLHVGNGIDAGGVKSVNENTLPDLISAYTDLVFDNLFDALDSDLIVEGGSVTVKTRDNGAGGLWSVVLLSSVTPNGNNIVASTGVPTLALVQQEIAIDKHIKSDNVDSTSLPVALAKNRIGANQDRWVMLFGDSHGWGQGAPDWDSFTGISNWSRHSSFPHNKGFMERIASFVRDKLDVQENVYTLGHPLTDGRLTTPDVKDRNMIDIEGVYPLQIQSGLVTCEIKDLADITTNTCTQFYGPVAKQATDTYSLVEYREKVGRGLFRNSMMTLAIEDADSFSPQGKDYFIELVPDSTYPGSGATFTQITYGSTGTIVAEYENTTGAFYLVSKQSSYPEWFYVGRYLFLPGYGVVKIAAIVGNGAVQIRNPNGTEIGAAAASLIYPGVRLYHGSYGQTCTMRIDLDKPIRAQYVHVRHKANGGKLRIAWTDSISNGCAMRPNLNSQVEYRDSANPWAPEFTNGLAQVNLVSEDHQLLTAGPAVTINSLGVEIDTSQLTPGVDEEVIYRIDWATKQIGSVFLEMTETNPGDTVETRGTLFDNNKVSNYSMGAHTVGAWIGSQSSNVGETRDHVADILNYTPIQPSHVIVQIPFVNEYIKQNSIAQFKLDLAEFVSRFESHLSTSNNYNSQGVDFMFFTSLRDRGVAFEGAASSPITYDDYAQAAKEFCSDNGHAFVDCEQRLFDLVNQGRIDYQRLYNDQIHPSDYANEMIFEALKTEYLYAAIG